VFGIGIRDGLESESESESVGGTDGVDANFANLHEFPGQDRCRRLPVNPQWFARIGAIRVRLFFIRVIRVIRGFNLYSEDWNRCSESESETDWNRNQNQ